jgi:hypothetical protein
MRQMGARDRARLAGGYGICGRELCCASWLDTFPAISIRMAKEQELPLNPQKISGLCGRLLCCLSYEEEGYREMRKSLPRVGQRCSTPTGEGRVIAVNILRRQVSLLVDGQRVEVQDRDLGTVVRWDPSSKSAPPPPSLAPYTAAAPPEIEDEGRIAESAPAGRIRQRRPSPRPTERESAPQPQRPPQRERPRGQRSSPPARPSPLADAASRTFKRGARQASGSEPSPTPPSPAQGEPRRRPDRGRQGRNPGPPAGPGA